MIYKPGSSWPISSWSEFREFLISQRELDLNILVISITRGAVKEALVGEELTKFEQRKHFGPVVLYGWRVRDVVAAPGGIMTVELVR